MFSEHATTAIYTLSLHDALPIYGRFRAFAWSQYSFSSSASSCRRPVSTSIPHSRIFRIPFPRSEEHTSELQSRGHIVCRLLLEKKKTIHYTHSCTLLYILQVNII